MLHKESSIIQVIQPSDISDQDFYLLNEDDPEDLIIAADDDDEQADQRRQHRAQIMHIPSVDYNTESGKVGQEQNPANG